MNGLVCSVADCAMPARARGLCNPHYQRWRRWGDPTGTPPPRPSPDDAPVVCGCDDPVGAGPWDGCARCGRPAVEHLAPGRRRPFDDLIDDLVDAGAPGIRGGSRD